MTRTRSPLLALAAFLALAAPVLASHVTPRIVDDADSCGPLTPGTVELVVDAGSLAGDVSDGDFEATVDIVGSLETGSITFSNASLPVRAAFVAGLDSGNLYEYPEPVTEDDGLTAPGGQPIQSVSFCYVYDGDAGNAGGGEATDAPPATDTEPMSSASGPSATALALTVTGLICLAAAGVVLMSARRAVRVPVRTWPWRRR